MDQADIRTSVTSSEFWWAASAAELKFLLYGRESRSFKSKAGRESLIVKSVQPRDPGIKSDR